MSYPVRPVVYPADLADATNGNLTYQLVSVWFPGRGWGWAHRETVRAWIVLTGACYTATGVVLTVVSMGDAYRSYSQQVQVFLQRYMPYYIAGSSSKKWWNGRWYWLKIGYAMVATPGASNHGWGLAIDVCEVRGSQIIGINGSAAWGWLLANAGLYGFSWESQTESWHIRLFTGDDPTQVVRSYRGETPPSPSEPVYDDDDMPTLYRDSRFANVFLVNGDVTTIGGALYASLVARGVPVIVDTHDQSLIAFMRKSQLKMAQMAPTGTGAFAAPSDLL